MILVDSSVWVDFFSATPGEAGRELRRLIAADEPLALSGIILQEVLQGLRRDAETIERILAQWDLLEPRGPQTFRTAAALFRQGRARGTTLTTVDALIAAVALEHRATLFTLDRDFTFIARFSPLKLYGLGQSEDY
ncbi:MAG TPA: PIN domain nuclease [Terriglobia bacterium]|nr:PIN domain nuclease [Terriglobia bacterium]